LDGAVGQNLKDAEANKDTCTIAKAEFKAEMTVLQTVNGQEFRNWQQFHDQRYQRQQHDLDNTSGLRNTGEFDAAYFGSDSQFINLKSMICAIPLPDGKELAGRGTLESSRRNAMANYGPAPQSQLGATAAQLRM
jgi:hypothetical protein